MSTIWEKNCMVRYTGPKNRIARRFGMNIFGKRRNPLLHRQHPPGMHGAKKRKKSDVGIQQEEQQKLKAMYGMLSHKQLVRYYHEAAKKRGMTSHLLLSRIESRLDVIVYRLKFAPTIFAAHQLVTHGHIAVNGKKVDIRSFEVKPGMVVSVAPKSQSIPIIRSSQESSVRDLPSYLQFSPTAFSGVLLHEPRMDEIPLSIPIDISMVCEYIARTN